ncbi:hypothetical protein D9619_000234 [Psilocybe cf. subviscida]|uniref:Uncharacterized protein n=1 Tax=Psilocybe cf. subviscida TaxID=2480587 RepID=A0A8H5BGA1_9AGAR|nr:hypothetical protein D9619_000234 [Psilocybe cf. subviscida]
MPLVHNASCSGASHSTDTTCCDSDIGDPRATQEADVEDSEWRQPQVDTEEYFAHDDRYDIQVAYTQQTWPDFEYDPRLPSRFSVTTTSTSTYVEIDMDELSFDDSARYYSPPFDDVQAFEPSSSPLGTPERIRNLLRPRF